MITYLKESEHYNYYEAHKPTTAPNFLELAFVFYTSTLTKQFKF